MLKLIIVDDEAIVCESMRRMVDWKSVGIDVIAVCYNGIDALDLIIDEHPDIVISDIKMPVMDGIDLLKQAKKISPSIEFIFLTGFAEFEYARTAMKYGVQNYLIKPCGEKEILEAVSSVSEKINADREKNTPKLFPNEGFAMQNLLVSKFYGYDSLLIKYLQESDYFDFDNTGYQAIEIYPFSQEESGKFIEDLNRFWQEKYPDISLHIISTRSSARIFFKKPDGYLSDKFHVILTEYAQRYFGEIRRIIENNYTNLQSLTGSLVEYMKTSDAVFFYMENKQIPLKNSNSGIESSYLAIKQILSGNEAEKEYSRSELTHMLQSINNLYTLKGILSILVQKVEAEQTINPELSFHPQLYTDAQTLSDAFINWITTLNEKTKTSSSYKDYIQTTISYLEDHINDSSLSLKWIAENVLYMNVDYLSKQFLKQTGMKFSQYLNKLRIEKAKLLLINSPELTMNEIAESIGCGNNPFYFSQLFKKHTGKTPSAFAKAQKTG